MEVRICKEKDCVSIVLSGRLDSTAATDANARIDQGLAAYEPICDLVCDAQDLEYISSAGLRIFLMLAKKYRSFRVVNANQNVYEVFDMTGFTKMMTVERALRQLNIEGLNEIGRGGVGIVYRIDDETIIKVFPEGTSLDEVKREITMAKESFVLGMPTAISFDIVRVGDRFGLVYELLKAQTLSTIVAREPEKVDDYARLYANMFRQLHSIEVPSYSPIPEATKQIEKSIHKIARYFDTAGTDILLKIIDNIPHANRLLHCDLQPKNIMMQGTEPMLIDMGEVCSGHPLMDLGYSYSAMVTFVGDFESVIGLPRELGNKLWMRMADYYFEGLSPSEILHRIQQIEVVSRVRNFSWLSLSDFFPEAIIRECQQLFEVKVVAQKEKLLDISKTFNDWVI